MKNHFSSTWKTSCIGRKAGSKGIPTVFILTQLRTQITLTTMFAWERNGLIALRCFLIRPFNNFEWSADLEWPGRGRQWHSTPISQPSTCPIKLVAIEHKDPLFEFGSAFNMSLSNSINLRLHVDFWLFISLFRFLNWVGLFKLKFLVFFHNSLINVLQTFHFSSASFFTASEIIGPFMREEKVEFCWRKASKEIFESVLKMVLFLDSLSGDVAALLSSAFIRFEVWRRNSTGNIGMWKMGVATCGFSILAKLNDKKTKDVVLFMICLALICHSFPCLICKMQTPSFMMPSPQLCYTLETTTCTNPVARGPLYFRTEEYQNSLNKFDSRAS